MPTNATNSDGATVRSFGHQWSRFDQTKLSDDELRARFDEYFHIFPWSSLPQDARGADIGCGSGRWSKFAAMRVGKLHCVDASDDALRVAEKNLAGMTNVIFHRASVGELPFEDGSLDFAYSLGVLHHVPDTSAAIGAVARTLKRGAPLLLYLYYAFDSRPFWYRTLWKISDTARRSITRLPPSTKSFVCDAIAAGIYWPLARIARAANAAGIDISNFPLALYRDRSFYTMRTDARDRFGTPLEKRFRADEIRRMMKDGGLTDIRFSDVPPFWCALGRRA